MTEARKSSRGLNDDQMTRLRAAFDRQKTNSAQLVERLRDERARQTDFIADTRTLRMVPVPDEAAEDLPKIPQRERLEPIKPRVAIVPAGDTEEWYDITGPVAANAHAHAQISSQLGIPKPYYQKMLVEQPDLLAHNVNTWFDADPKRRLVRTMKTNGGGPVMSFARGWLSNSYRRLDSLELTDVLMPLFNDESNGWQIDQCGLTDIAMHIEASFPSMRNEVAVGDEVALAVKITTSDVGGHALSVAVGVRRLVCANLMVVPNYSKRIIHMGGAQDDIAEILTERTMKLDDQATLAKMRDFVAAMANKEVFGKLVATFREAKTATLVDPVAASQVLQRNVGLSESELHVVQSQMMLPENGNSMWGLANALTATARTIDFERKADLERAAGKLMESVNTWKQYTEAAA